MYVNNGDITYFDSFGIEHILKEKRTLIDNKNIKTNIFRIQEYDLTMRGCLKTDECNSIKYDFPKTPNIYQNLRANISNEQQLRLNKINQIKDYLLAEIRYRELISKNISKYIASFEYFSKSLIFLSAVASSNSIPSVFGAPAGIMGTSSVLTFSITSGFVKKWLKTTANKKKKKNKIVMLARSKLNSIEGKIFKALMNNEISHEDFMAIFNEEKKYQALKESIRMMKSHISNAENVSLIEECKKEVLMKLLSVTKSLLIV